MKEQGSFKGWIPQRGYGFIRPDKPSPDVFLHSSQLPDWWEVRAGARVEFERTQTERGPAAASVTILTYGPPPLTHPLGDAPSLKGHSSHAVVSSIQTYGTMPGALDGPGVAYEDDHLVSEDIEELNTKDVTDAMLREISTWKREARAEDTARYFWHVHEVDQISQGGRYFVIGRKGSGKTAICEYFNRLSKHDVFAERLSFKNFPFNELYQHSNDKYTPPNQFITIWKYLIYSSVCRLMIKNESVDGSVRTLLSQLYEDRAPLSRRIGKWVGNEFGVSLFGLSLKVSKPSAQPQRSPANWLEHVDVLEDLIAAHAGNATYYVLFDELDEDYRDMISRQQFDQYTALITSLFKAVQDIRTTFDQDRRIFPVIFLRDDIYDLVKDNDKNKWGDFRVDLNWDEERLKRLIAFRVSRAISPSCHESLPFESAWEKVFGSRTIGIGQGKKKKVSTFDFISRSTLLRPRDFVSYLQNCAQYAVDSHTRIGPEVVRYVDKAFSNYLRQELTDELFAILPDIANIFDAISQLRKWNFSIHEFERAYRQQVEQGFIQEKNVKFVVQALYWFSVIGNTPRVGYYIFRYRNPEARLNFNERIVVHRGLFKALQIL